MMILAMLSVMVELLMAVTMELAVIGMGTVIVLLLMVAVVMVAAVVVGVLMRL